MNETDRDVLQLYSSNQIREEETMCSLLTTWLLQDLSHNAPLFFIRTLDTLQSKIQQVELFDHGKYFVAPHQLRELDGVIHPLLVHLVVLLSPLRRQCFKSGRKNIVLKVELVNGICE